VQYILARRYCNRTYWYHIVTVRVAIYQYVGILLQLYQTPPPMCLPFVYQMSQVQFSSSHFDLITQECCISNKGVFHAGPGPH